MAFIVYGYAGNPRTRLVKIVAAAQNIPLEMIEVVPRENIGRRLLMDKFPRSNGKIPALEAPNIELTETISIALYLAKINGPPALLGNGSLEQEAEVVSWMSWANQEFIGTLARWFLPLIPNLSRPAPYDKLHVKTGKADSLAMLDTLERVMSTKKPHLVGEAMTLADIFVAVMLSRGLQWVLDATWRKKYPNCMKHFDMVRAWQPVQDVVPDFELIDEETPNVNPYERD